MKYPIFNTFINRIKSDLNRKNIEPAEFNVWTDETINATGLEIKIDLSGLSNHVKDVTINFDWDKFREMNCARQLPGMEKHPLLTANASADHSSVLPGMDVEVTWSLKPDVIMNDMSHFADADRIERASAWMDTINKRIHDTLPADYIISRWHIEVDGDTVGRYLSTMSLISYFQFTLNQMTDLNQILDFISKKLQLILIRSNRIIQIAESSLKAIAA
jgi:hypothetical protein